VAYYKRSFQDMSILHKSVHFCAECLYLEKIVYDVFMLPNKHQQKYRNRLLKEPDSIMTKSIYSAFPILLLLVVSVVPANAQTYTNNQSTTCVGNNNSGCTTISGGRTVAPIRTITRAVRTLVPMKVMTINRSSRR
jgi:hypothetical protein